MIELYRRILKPKLTDITSQLSSNLTRIEKIEIYRKDSIIMRNKLVISESQLDAIKHKCAVELNNLYIQRGMLKWQYVVAYKTVWNEHIIESKLKRIARDSYNKETALTIQDKISDDDLKFILEHTHLFK